MFNLPFSGSIPIYIALGFFILSVVLLIRFIYRRVYRLIHRVRRGPVARLDIVASTLRLLLILFVVALSAATLFLLAFIQSYTAFTDRKLVAMVYCTPVEEGKEEMDLWLLTFESPNAGYLSHHRLRGQTWAVEGHILKWEGWLNFLGLRTMHKLTRVRGRFLKAEDEASKPATVYSLVGNEEDPHWRWLYEFGPRLPFINAVYGNTVYTFPSEAKTFRIFVTPSGFMIEEGER